MAEWEYVGPQQAPQGWEYTGPKPDPSWGDYAMDAVKGAPGALARGANAIMGLPGDARELAASGAGYLAGPEAGQAVRENWPMGWMEKFIPGAGMPTSDQLNAATADRLPKSQHLPGQIINAGVETVIPGMVAGPAGMARGAVGGFVTGAGSEAAGKAAGRIDPRLETPTKIATSIGLGYATTPKTPKWTGGTTLKETTDTGKEIYSGLNGVRSTPATAMRAKAEVTAALASEGYNPRYHHKITQWLDELGALQPKMGKTDPMSAVTHTTPKTHIPKVTFDDYVQLRGHSLEDVFKNGSQMEKSLAAKGKAALDSVIEAAPEFKGLPESAKQAWFLKKKLESLEGLKKLVEMRSTYNNADDYALALKREAQAIERAMVKGTYSGRKYIATFTPAERKLISEMASDKTSGKIAKQLQAYAASNRVYGPQGTTLGVIGSLLYGDPTPLAYTMGAQAIGSGAKAYRNARARNAMGTLDAMHTGAQKVPLAQRFMNRSIPPALYARAAAGE